MRKRVLIIEDNPFLAGAFVSLVEDELGCVAVTVGSTAHAVSLVETGFDLALLDVEVTDGVTYPLAARLMQRGIPVVFISASDPAKVPLELAAAPFLSKPVRPSELLATARHYLK